MQVLEAVIVRVQVNQLGSVRIGALFDQAQHGSVGLFRLPPGVESLFGFLCEHVLFPQNPIKFYLKSFGASKKNRGFGAEILSPLRNALADQLLSDGFNRDIVDDHIDSTPECKVKLCQCLRICPSN